MSALAWIFLILTSQTKNTLMLQALASVAKLMKNKETRDALLSIKNPTRIIKVIEESGVDVKKTITASNIMTTDITSLKPDDVLLDAIEVVISAKGSAVPVLSVEKNVVGDVSSREIIKVGLPDYMGMLDNVDFLNIFEPFEHYFKEERTLKVSDIMNKEILTVLPEAPIIEVAHKLTSSETTQVYIVKDNQLLGTISRNDILTKVLQL